MHLTDVLPYRRNRQGNLSIQYVDTLYRTVSLIRWSVQCSLCGYPTKTKQKGKKPKKSAFSLVLLDRTHEDHSNVNTYKNQGGMGTQ